MGNSEKQYIEIFEQNRAVIDQHSVAPMNVVREEAFSLFKAKGLPGKKEERYRYTDMQKLFAPDYGLNLRRLDIPVNPYEAFRCDVPNLSTHLCFVVNDQVYKSKETTQPLTDDNVFVASFHHPEAEKILVQHYGRLAAADDDGIAALNTMLAQDGLLVYVPRGVNVGRTLQVINILRSDVPLMINRRVLVVLEENSSLKLLFCDHSADDLDFLATEVMEVVVGDNARLELYSLEETHQRCTRVSNTKVEMHRDSRFTHNVITLHNGITRNLLDIDMVGEGATCLSGGCVIADKEQVVDNNSLITHHVPHCTSSQLYKYVVNDKSTCAFAGRVLVSKGAQQTISQMRNQNLCTSKEARMYTQPMLEIYADDVKCSHGSTVGQLNDAAMFYMRQRGISESEAKMLLQQAFVGEVIDMVKLEPLRDRLRYLVDKRFRGELFKCEGCKLCR